MPSQIIQGIECSWRDVFPDEEILYLNLPQNDQYFKREPHPFTDEEIEAMADRVHQFTQIQAHWKDREDVRFDKGVYAMINGKLKFIPGSYWCYVSHWMLENGEHPDYREDEREFAIFLEHCYYRTPLYGCSRPKGRRQGATSFGGFFEWFVAGRNEYMNCGTVSFNDDAAKDVFVNMIMPGFKALLPCFQADFNSPDDGKSFLHFIKSDKRKKGVGSIKRQGLNSMIDYKPTTLNSYTNKRLSFVLLDEFGRWEKLDCNLYWSKLSKALRRGKKKVGFAYLPTVVNPKDKGGENYKRFYQKSDQRKYGMNTPTGCVIYIIYGTQCYAGCIDKFGESVIEDPIEPIMGNDGEWITEGSKTLILRERALLEGIELMEHRRDWPIDESDIFAFETGACEFNEKMLIGCIQSLELDPPYLRKIRLYTDFRMQKFANLPGKMKREVKWMDDESAGWLLLEEPEEKNKFRDLNGFITPLNTHKYCIGVDTFRIGFADKGSEGTICVFKKSHLVNGEELGMYPVAMYTGRPRLIQHLYDEVIKACMFWGCRVNFEISAGDFFYGYFYQKNSFDIDCLDMLYWTPAVDPNKKNPTIRPGTETASPFELAAQLEAAKIYMDGVSTTGYNGNMHRVKFVDLLKQCLDYDHANRTPFDLVISMMMALLPALHGTNIRHQPGFDPKPKVLIPTYKLDLQQN